MVDKTTARVICGLLVVTAVLIVSYAWLKSESDMHASNADSRRSLYDLDCPVSSPVPVDTRFILLTPQELAKAPVTDFFESPLGTANGAFTYIAQTVGSENKKRGGLHTGQDLNGIGGENTDEGLPVRATARGLLIYAGEPSPDWGNVVVLLHRLPDGRYLQSLYAHLKEVSSIPLGSIVGRGEQIGTVGTAHGRYAAHLHFEMIESIANEAGLPGYGKTVWNRIDPSTILKKYAQDPSYRIPDPVIALKEAQRDKRVEKLMNRIFEDNGEAAQKLLQE